MSRVEKREKMKMIDEGNEEENINGDQNIISYPQPLAKYTDVISDKNLFMQTLGKLHASMKTKFMVPIIGGKDLDLHQLFKEVTSRGGIEKVIEQRRWREVTASFSFPSTATNASFVLRKYYMSLLRHYEQIYYFESPGWNSQSNDNPSSPPTPNSSKRSSEAQIPTHKRKIKDETLAPPATYPTVVGIIDGKFEHGYFVTVTAGSQKLRGVLYHVSDQSPHPSLIPPQPVFFQPGATSFADPGADLGRPVKRRRKRRKRVSRMDPDHPKPNRSGYNFFFKEQHARLKPLHPGKDRVISRMIGELWSNLSEHEKDVYQQRGRVDKERYQNEMLVYREKQKTGSTPIISDAVPLDQRPAPPDTIPDLTVQGVDINIQQGNLVLHNNNDGNNNDDEDNDNENDSYSDMEDSDEDDLEFDLDADVAGPSGERKSEDAGFELKKREMDVDEVEDFSDKLKEGEVKLSGDLNDKLEEESELGEGLNDKLKEGEVDLNDKLEGMSKLGEEDSNVKLFEREVKMGEDLNDKLIEDESKLSEDPKESKLGEDSNVKLVGGEVKLGDVLNENKVEGEVKLGEDLNEKTTEGEDNTGSGFDNPDP